MKNVMNGYKSLEDYPEVLTAKDIAEYLGIGYVKALNILKFGNLPNVRIGNTFRVSKKNFKDWLDEPVKKSINLCQS